MHFLFWPECPQQPNIFYDSGRGHSYLQLFRITHEERDVLIPRRFFIARWCFPLIISYHITQLAFILTPGSHQLCGPYRQLCVGIYDIFRMYIGSVHGCAAFPH